MRRSKSTLFLMEQLIVIAVFSICAAACVKILTESYYTAKDTRDIGNAILAAENGAECYKARYGDSGVIAQTLGGSVGSIDGNTAVIVYYNKDWRVCEEADALYTMRISIYEVYPESGSMRIMAGEISVDRTGDNELTLISFPVAVIMNDGGV